MNSLDISTKSSRGATFGSSVPPSQRVDQVITNFDVVKRDPRLPCISMKTHKRRDDFFGRQDILDLIDKNLLPENRRNVNFGEDSLRSFALCGMGGIGKTQIAVEYAYSRRPEFDAIFFITADGKAVLSEEFAQIAQQLGLEDESEANDLTVSMEIVKGWLSNPVRSYDAPPSATNEVSWLLIFDNVDNMDVLAEFWPTTGLGAVLITSRDSLAKNQIYTANNGIDLPPFPAPDAVKFLNTLTKRAPHPTQDKDAAEVAEKLGGLPLLITQMAGVMARLRLSYSDFIKLYNASGIEQISMTGTTMSTPQQVYSISSKLGFDGLSLASFGLLSLIATLDPDRIPEAILISACSKDPVTSFPNNLTQYYEARAQLLQTSLINQNTESGDIWVHRIVQDVTKGKLDSNRLTQTYNLAISAVSDVWPFSRLETRFLTARHKDCAPLFPSILRLKDTFNLMISLGTFQATLPLATLFSDAGWYRFERGFQEESKEWFQLVQQICDGLEDKSSEAVAYMIRDTHHNLGTASGETNDTELFLKHSGIWLELLRQRKTPDGELVVDYELGMGYNEHGVAQAMNGHCEVAITHFSKAIEYFQALPHYESTMLGWPASNKGLMYWILGDLEAAERTLLELIEVFRKANGVDDTLSFKTGKMLYALGNVHVSQGKYEKGLEYHARCLRQYRVTLGDRHHRIGDICHRLADDNLRFHHYAEAQVLISQALKVFSGRQQYRQELARSTFKAAQVSRAIGDEGKADEQLRMAFELRCSLVPDDTRNIDEIHEDDYDKLVVFWSR
ncbi:P-loop containing nucleoside triphosphate hydrolase protein [Nemania sp. FL0031]|nr:P-loop containing nucleoside triphosphate hydrolase protein [Nemania sp. FL0031]